MGKKYVVDESSLVNIADEIRALSGAEDYMSPETMAITLNEENTYFSTHITGQEELISQIKIALENKTNAGFADGKQAEYDCFWDRYQENGDRTDYTTAFAGNGWDATTFKPKYDIVPVTTSQMFARGSYPGDLKSYLDSLGIKLDFSKATSLIEIFYHTRITRVGTIDTRGCSSLSHVFAYALNNLHTVDHLILKDDGTQAFANNSFIQWTGLENIIISGVIGQTVNMQWSTKVSHDSIVSIVNALSDTTSGLSVTLSQTAVDDAFTEDEWEALIATKNNWTISLV